MVKPASMNTPTNIKNSYRLFPYFRDCIGAIDGTHVTTKVPRSMSAAFRRRKHYTIQNVLAAVDFDMRFTYVLAGICMPTWNSTSLQENKVPHQRVLYEAPTSECERVVQPQTLSLIVTIERAFAALKNRFKVIDQKPFHTFDTQVNLVLACCILHNWILGWGKDEFFEEVITFDEVETGHGVEAGDNDTWKVKRQEWADAMWEARGNTTI
ncbi:uncharacterized protein [Lolium perenne]|uniref:uncharacterized protein n=1 Tax=Lolium perenne TaxID=4522 RepID=UPI003A98E94C